MFPCSITPLTTCKCVRANGSQPRSFSLFSRCHDKPKRVQVPPERLAVERTNPEKRRLKNGRMERRERRNARQGLVSLKMSRPLSRRLLQTEEAFWRETEREETSQRDLTLEKRQEVLVLMRTCALGKDGLKVRLRSSLTFTQSEAVPIFSAKNHGRLKEVVGSTVG